MIPEHNNTELLEYSDNDSLETVLLPEAKLLRQSGKGKLILERVLKQISERKLNNLWSDFDAHHDWDNYN